MRLRRRRTARVVAGVVVIAGLIAPLGIAGPAAAQELGFQGEEGRLVDKDARSGRVAPTAAQTARVAALRATARWNSFGTPRSLIRTTGHLAAGLPAEPEAAARRFLKDNAVLFRLSSTEIDRLDVVGLTKVGDGHVVLLRQQLGTLRAGYGGLISVALLGDKALYVTSSNTGNTNAPAAATLSATQAWLRAAADIGRSVSSADISGVENQAGWTTFTVRGLPGRQRARLVAFPTYTQGNRPAFETVVLDPEGDERGPTGFTHFVDARTGKVWMRRDRVNFLSSNPRWKVFPANPRELLVPPLPPPDPGPADPALYSYSSDDIRQVWCWQFLTAAEKAQTPIPCDRVLFREQQRTPVLGEWDRLFDPTTGSSLPSFTTDGNNAADQQARLSPLTGGTPPEYRPVSPNREYIYPWGNQWNESKCNPSTLLVPGTGADIDAAIVNLFGMHNRAHDWSYHLGFQEQTWNLQRYNFGRATPPAESREGDPEFGGAQAGALTGGPPSFLGRDNANQITLNDGIPGVTNMYLWQPIAAAFYAPCVDGDFDMSVIVHEYTHAISNRMAAGPDGGLDGRQARSMGESWSDLAAVEYLNEYGFVPVSGENPFSVGSYVTGDKKAGIRNYGMDDSPLNWADIGYDVTGPQVHADGEIWSAINFEIRKELIARYGAGNLGAQVRCANGQLPPQNCPGNRRWIAMMFAAWLTMQPDVDMQDARNSYLTADRQLFGSRPFGSDVVGANADLLWKVFSRRGIGLHAENADSRDGDSEEIIDDNESDPEPDYQMPPPFEGQNATVTFNPVAGDGSAPTNVRIFVGDYEARVTPVADTISGEDDPGRDRPNKRRFAPGTYRFVAMAPGFGHVRFTRTFSPGQTTTVNIPMFLNVASKNNGATATGNGSNHEDLIDDTEDTQWFDTAAPVQGDQVTVALDDGPGGNGPGSTPFNVKRVRVSAMLRPALPLQNDPFDRDPSQNRFAALRQFEILTCTKAGLVACDQDAQFQLRFTSPADAFPSIRPRPRAPELIIRSFNIPDTNATHVRIRVLENQCTGFAGYHGEQDSDPLNTTDCRAGTSAATREFAAELQVLRTEAPF
jgi:extracellular elastinolytic metalloproteinase